MRLLQVALVCVVVTAAPGVASGQPSPARSAMDETGLVVGNVQFAGHDGVLRYDGKGRFLDAMLPDEADQHITCCLAFGPDDNLYVSSPGTMSVLRLNGLTGEILDQFVPAGSGGLVVPLILVFHDGYLYVGDTGTGAIHRYRARTGAYVDDLLPNGTQGMTEFGDLQHFVFAPDGVVYVAAELQGRIMRFNARTGVYLGDLVPAAAGFHPSGMTLGPDGLLYAGSAQSNEVRRYNIWRGRMVDVFIRPGSGGLQAAVGVVFGPDGDLYVASASAPGILRYDGRTGRPKGAFVPGGSGGLDGPRTLAFKSTVTICHQGRRHHGLGRTLVVGYMTGLDLVRHGDTIGACR